MTRALAGVLSLLLACPAAAQVRVQTGKTAPGVGGQAGAVNGPAGVSAGPKTDLPAPTLLPTLQTPLTPEVKAGDAAAQTNAVPPVTKSGVQAQTAPVLKPVSRSLALPSPIGGEEKMTVPAAKTPQEQGSIGSMKDGGAHAAAVEAGKGAEERDREGSGGEKAVLAGRAMFDGAGVVPMGIGETQAPAVRTGGKTFWGNVWSLLPDRTPDDEGGSGAKVRVGGVTYRLERKLAEDEYGSVYHANAHETVILVLKPGAEDAYAEELAALRELGKTRVPHFSLKEVSRDGRVLVLHQPDGWDAEDSWIRDSPRYERMTGLADLAAHLILIGRTADLSASNLYWKRYGGMWMLKKAKGFGAGAPGDVLRQILGSEIPKQLAFEPAVFLSALRGRLGPASGAWKLVLRGAEGVPELRKALEALERADAARPPPPRLEFAAAEPDKTLDHSLVTPREMRKRLGYSPLSVKPKHMLHGDDPGKLNTKIYYIQPEGRPEVAVKEAEPRIIKAELFMRKVVQRWFSKYFHAPDSLASLTGSGEFDSYMVMEYRSGGPSWGRIDLDKAQRVALGILMRGFGVYDVNPGNILYWDGKAVLIDFEQALGRAHPVTTRIPDESILDELPWVKKSGLTIEDFQPGIDAWRKLFDRPETQKELETMLLESGYTQEETRFYMRQIRENTADLRWTLLTDLEFAEHLGRR